MPSSQKAFALTENVSPLVYVIEFGLLEKLKMQLASSYPQLKDSTEFTALIEKKFRQDDLGDILRDNPNFYLLMRIALIDFLDNIYPAQREVNSEYQEQLIKRCEYLV